MVSLKAPHTAEFRFYEELNVFLPRERRCVSFDYRFRGNPGIKDAIEALGVPHTEVDLIVVDGQSRGFDYQLRHGDRVAVYPVFESIDISPIVSLREAPLRKTAFVLDVHLGKLARLLRLLGLDVLYRKDFSDREIADISVCQHRIILTRDRRLLYDKRITHGYYVRSIRPLLQAREVVARFQLENSLQPFSRCLLCNGEIEPVAKALVEGQLEPKAARYYQEFFRCKGCGKVYWKGSHFRHLVKQLQTIRQS